MTKTILAIVALSALSGCSVWGGKTFQCPGADTDGATCMSARQVYEATNVTDRVAPNYRDGKPIKPGEQRLPAVDAEGHPVVSQQQSLLNTYLPPLPDADAPLPVRTPAKVMRIRIFPWEDRDRDLNAGGFVYTEIEGRQWTLGDDQVSRVQANVITPLAMPKNATPGQFISPLNIPFQGARQRNVDAPAAQSPSSLPRAAGAPGPSTQQAPTQFRTPTP